MPTYATADDCTAYTEGLVVDDPVAFDRLIERAERDVDRLLIRVGASPPGALTGPQLLRQPNGLKLDPTTLQDWVRDALARAVAAQVEYRLSVGEARLAGPRAGRIVKGPDFEIDETQAGPVKGVGPKVRDELSETGLLLVWTGVA